MDYYPLLFHPIYKEMLWGGDKLGTEFSRKLPSNKIGESRDVSCRANEMSIVENGTFAGLMFSDVIDLNSEGFLGSGIYTDNYTIFPLLIAVIAASSDLSIQVHPTDDYAVKYENEPFGKNETWYIAQAPTYSSIIIGLQPGVKRETLENALIKGEVEHLLYRLPVEEGDVVHIPQGHVHAITAGVIIYEIQQNNDVTYRLYDYGRLGADGKPRELHIKQALDVIDFSDSVSKKKIPGITVMSDGHEITYYIASKQYAIEKLKIKSELSIKTGGERFNIYTCVKGSCVIETKNGSTAVNLSRSVFVPAGLREYKIIGECELLKSYVPDVESDIIQPLLNMGYSKEEIAASIYYKGLYQNE